MCSSDLQGETLVEVLITILIISIAVTALIASLATAAASGASHRKVQTTDVVIRNYAEALKQATAGCTVGSTYSPVFTPPDGYSVAFAADSGPSGSSASCPNPTTIQVLTLSVTPSAGAVKTMQLAVRTP